MKTILQQSNKTSNLLLIIDSLLTDYYQLTYIVIIYRNNVKIRFAYTFDK